jgi:sugar phosphate isomerase/epimerase
MTAGGRRKAEMARADSANASLFGCNSYAYMLSHGAEACLANMAELGFREFELMVHPGHLWPAELSAERRRVFRRTLEQRGLQLTTLNLPNIDINIASTTPEMRAYSLDLLSDTIRLAGELGAYGVVMSPGKASPLLPAKPEVLKGHFFAALDRLGPIAKASGTALWIENVPFSFWSKIDEIMEALASYGDDDIHVVYDIANAFFVGEDFADGLKTCRARLAMVHLSDTSRDVYRHDPVGAGDVPFAQAPAALAAVGYRARPVLEIISPDPDRDIPASADRLVALGFSSAP